MTFHGIEFQARREALNLTQDDLASIFKLRGRVMISRWENGVAIPRDPQSIMDTLSKLEHLFLELVDRYFDAGENAIELPDAILCASHEDYAQACPELAAQGIPWKLHRNAVTHAHMQLRAEGYEIATFGA